MIIFGPKNMVGGLGEVYRSFGKVLDTPTELREASGGSYGAYEMSLWPWRGPRESWGCYGSLGEPRGALAEASGSLGEHRGGLGNAGEASLSRGAQRGGPGEPFVCPG